MKILIIRPWPSLLDVTKNTYNIQEVGLAKALVKRGHSTDILFWTDGDEMTVEVEAEGGKSIRVFYRHGKVLLKNVWFSGQDALFAQYDVLQTAEYNQMFSWHLAGKYPEKTVIYHGPYYSPFNKNYNRMCRVFDAFFVLDVLAEVRKSDPDACLYLIGDGDEAYRDSVKAAIGEKGLTDWVFWQKKAPQYQMKGVYQQADFFLLPTEYEIFGMVLLEAMFFRRVVLTTPNGGADMLLRSGENGIVLEKSDPARWAEALLDAAADPAKKARMEQAAYETVIHENTWDALADRFLKGYETR